MKFNIKSCINPKTSRLESLFRDPVEKFLGSKLVGGRVQMGPCPSKQVKHFHPARKN